MFFIENNFVLFVNVFSTHAKQCAQNSTCAILAAQGLAIALRAVYSLVCTVSGGGKQKAVSLLVNQASQEQRNKGGGMEGAEVTCQETVLVFHNLI